jgi:hypothetical protein
MVGEVNFRLRAPADRVPPVTCEALDAAKEKAAWGCDQNTSSLTSATAR